MRCFCALVKHQRGSTPDVPHDFPSLKTQAYKKARVSERNCAAAIVTILPEGSKFLLLDRGSQRRSIAHRLQARAMAYDAVRMDLSQPASHPSLSLSLFLYIHFLFPRSSNAASEAAQLAAYESNGNAWHDASTGASTQRPFT